MERERILEIVLAAVFILLLVFGSITVIRASGGSSQETETTITNSFNTYTYNYNTYPENGGQYRYTLTARQDYADYYSNYYHVKNLRYQRSDDKRYLRYGYDADFRVAEGLFGNDINRYEVFVRNKEYVGGNFKVVFYFGDYYGNVDSQAMTNYVPAREEKLFLLKDVSPSRYDYKRWWYTVDSLDKVKTESYFYGN